MTTSITDARFTSLHFTEGHLRSLFIDEPPETGWSVMPGYDQSLDIPGHLEPPRLDADETLPSQLHPSYPYGRPPTVGKPVRPWQSAPGNLLGTVAAETEDGLNGGFEGMFDRWGKGERWEELGMRGVVEIETRKEVPPGMAGAKRPPSPPSPSLHPSLAPQPRSNHLRNLYARQRQATPPPAADPFDAPVPNETFAEQEVEEQREEGQGVDGVQAQNVNGVNMAQAQREGTQNQPETRGGGGDDREEMDDDDG